MMTLKESELKNTANASPHSRNPVYQKEILGFGCCYCQEADKRKKKTYPSLYSLFAHFFHDHKDEQDYHEKIIQLAKLVIEGSLR